jgi:thymidylate synthase (FAD)
VSKVTLVGVTSPRIEGVNSAEELVAYAARVSNPTNQMNSETAPKLLAYLIRNQHWSPLEMVHVVMEIETTRDIARQILRHRSFSFQEFSQRYATVESLGFETREARLQDTKNRQNSIETSDVMLSWEWEAVQQDVLRTIESAYSYALEKGIAKEQARAVLPEGMTKSRMYMSGTLRSWLHYCLLRTDKATQKEHRIIADTALEILKSEFPSISEIVGNNNG